MCPEEEKHLEHHGIKGMKWGVRKDSIKLDDFKMGITKVDLSGTPGTQYKWLDSQNKPVAKFTTFDWWDGKNIENLKVYDSYKKQGLSYQLLDYATKELGCKNLTVAKNNEVAKHVYDKYGFKVSEEDTKNYYMQLNKNELAHIGIARRSGRYKWGSGNDPYQHSGDFESRVAELKAKGYSEKQIAEAIGLKINELRIQQSLAKDERRAPLVETAAALRDKGLSLNEIAEKMGYKNDSSVRSLLNAESNERMKQAKNTAALLKDIVDKEGMIDVGPGVERELNISPEKMKRALYLLQMEGYNVYAGGIPSVTNKGVQINRSVLTKPEIPHKDIYNFDQVKYIKDYTSHDNGETFDKLEYPKSMDSSRIMVRYKDEGGLQQDGAVEIRRGVPDLSLGDAHYAQVRILVDKDKYIKGMAIHGKDTDFPEGVDLIFNTNKPKGTPLEKVLKPITDDPDNPFGATIKAGGQSYYIDKNGKKQLSVINKRAEEGDWSEWKDGLPAQFLSKQAMPLIKKQLNEAISDKEFEYKEICELTNPTVKKARLKAFADGCDATAIHLTAAALPGQKYHVILPVPTMKDNEVFATKYDNGTQVALIRYPHGGTFEIPILTVNNKQKDAINMLGKISSDTVAISSKVAERLSGADFDGDTVMVIPTNSKTKITSTPQLKQLEGFDPKEQYAYKEGIKLMKREVIDANGKKKTIDNTGLQMGVISNLITDMTLKGAPEAEVARAVKHSMVVIDAAKHKLDYKKSEDDNHIAELKKKWQGQIDPETGKYHEGASTIVSRSKTKTPTLKRQGSPKINIPGKEWYDPTRPEGALVYKTVHEEYVDPKTGKKKIRTQDITKMESVDDAYKLSSRTLKEDAYAEFANKMKSMSNQARKEIVSTGKIEYNSDAKAAYQPEVTHILSMLNTSLKNAPRERQAMGLANSIAKAKKDANPDMSKKDVAKEQQRALTASRNALGAKKIRIKLTDREWEAIQKGAISETQLKKIIDNMDPDELKQKATPRTATAITTAKSNKIDNMKRLGYSTVEIAKSIGVSVSTVDAYINPSKNKK